MIIVDNLFSVGDYKIVEKEILKHFPDIKGVTREDKTDFRLFDFDNEYDGSRESQPIFNIIRKYLWSDKVLEKTRNINDLAFRLYEKDNRFFTSLRIWPQTFDYQWHYDLHNEGTSERVWNRSAVTWIWYYKPKETYTGGELESKEYGKVEPKDNRLVLISSGDWHMIHKVKMLGDYKIDSIDGRINLVGAVTI